MTEQQALTRIESIAPGAFAGPLFAGNVGVGSYLNHTGLDWQIMAHIDEGHVRTIRLYRYERTGTETAEQCTAVFHRLVDEQRREFPSSQWHKMFDESDRLSIRGRVHTTLPNETVIAITAERLDWDEARCMIELFVSKQSL